MTLLDVAKNFTREIAQWVRKGVPVVPQEVFEQRVKECTSCEFFNAEAFGGRGKCNKCGCSSFKLFLATTKCPIDKWMPYEEKLDRKD